MISRRQQDGVKRCQFLRAGFCVISGRFVAMI